MISVESRSDGALVAIVRAPEPNGSLQIEKATIELSIWQERDGIVRARLRDHEHGALCYVQGNESLFAFGDALGLKVS
jgi:hypothetical protein